MLTSIIFTLIFLVFIFLFQQYSDILPSSLRSRPVREIIEAGLLSGCLLLIPFIRFDLLWLSGWTSAYVVFGLLAPLIMECGLRRRSLSVIGIRVPVNRKAIILVAILFGVYLIARLVIPPLLGAIFTFSWQDFLSYSILFPFVEEVIFRGMIQTRLEAVWGSTWAWILSGLFFGFHHYFVHYLTIGKSFAVSDVASLVFLMTFGMLLGVIYARTRSLLPSFLIHAINNLSLFPM